MLQVNTYLAPSPIHGVGVFASEDVKAGTVVWKFTPYYDRRISKDEYASLPVAVAEYIWYVSYFENADKQTLLFCCDNAAHTNHSYHPNTAFAGQFIIALRDIAKGEEITQDYRELNVKPPK